MPQTNWESIFENQVKIREELIERVKNGESYLKSNRPYLIVSDIAAQFYSEAKVELDYIFGKIETEQQKEGAELHDRMAEDAIAIKFKELIKDIPKVEEIVIVETSLLMKFHDEIIVGKPDVIIFRRGIPILVFEYKFSKYSIIFDNQKVQAQIYCQILKQMGYNTDLLYYGIIIAPRNMTKKSDKVKKIPQEVLQGIQLDSLIQKQELKLQFEKINVFIYKFDPEEAQQNLEWAIEYWKGERENKLMELLKECEKHEHKEKCLITYSIVQDLLKKFSENLIAIYGIGSFFDRKLPEDWIKNDIDIICIVKDMEKIPKMQDWTDVRRLDYKKGHYTANVFFNSLEGLKNEEVYEKESWANYKWALLDFKIPPNSVLLHGRSIHGDLPELNSISYDHEDILRHAFYHLDVCFRLKPMEASMKRFTKGVFKLSFLICVYFDSSFRYTSMCDITLKINELVKEKKIDIYLHDIIVTCAKYKRGAPVTGEFSRLRVEFIIYCYYLLFEGKLWKKYDWEELILFCNATYNGLNYLEDIAKRERNKYYSRSKKDGIP